MNQSDKFLHTTHRTVTWFRKAYQNHELELSPPFQRQAVWTNLQKSFLIDTILNGLPIPELYMQDVGSDTGDESHVLVDGQQRIRAVLEFTEGKLSLEGDDVSRTWRGLQFDDLLPDQKKAVFNYRFVVRILPSDLREEDIRLIFSRINKNTVALNDQEIRNATYWGPFIQSIQAMADSDSYWSEAGVFSSKDHRRMLDHEFISELSVAFLHGAQNKKDKLDTYYQLYEEHFEDRDRLEQTFRKVTSELSRLFPRLSGTRWRKKSDFYTLFLELASRSSQLPFDQSKLDETRRLLLEFGESVDNLVKLEERDWGAQDDYVVLYARAVARAASDRGNRMIRAAALSQRVFGEPSKQAKRALEDLVRERNEGVHAVAVSGDDTVHVAREAGHEGRNETI
jgi:hypothetical protein